jgi:tetratricopeptide (TPR) repeat protein
VNHRPASVLCINGERRHVRVRARAHTSRYAILLDYIGEYEGTKARIEKAYIVREHMELAIKLDPLDATSRHIFGASSKHARGCTRTGLWQYIFADMPTYQRRIAAWIYTTPPTATYEEALESFLAAEHTQPNFYSKNLLYIGRCMIKLGQMNKGVEYLRRAYAAPVVSADDMETKINSEKELKLLGRFESAY